VGPHTKEGRLEREEEEKTFNLFYLSSYTLGFERIDAWGIDASHATLTSFVLS
jgi:hypothetical protein